MTVTFDPANKNANITLSNGDLTATKSAGAGTHGKAYSTGEYKTTGKWYYEVTCDLVTGNSLVGVSLVTGSTADGSLGNDTNGYGINQSGNGFYNNVNIFGPVGTFTTGGVVGIAFDADADTVGFYFNGSLVHTRTGVTGDWAPAVSIYGSIGGAFTANFGATTWAYSPPIGYSGWGGDPLVITVGTGAATLEQLTASGSRIAAGAATLEEFTAVGGYNGLGAATFEYLTMFGAGGLKYGQGTLTALTGSGTGRQQNSGAATLQVLLASGKGPATISVIEESAPAPTLSAEITTGGVITFAGTVPAPILGIGTKDFRGTAPVPTLVAAIATGTVITVDVDAPAPTLAAVTDNPAIITVAGSARVPILVATLAAGRIITFAGGPRALVLSASVLTGNVATAVLEAATPILVAAGYPAYTITFAGTSPVPYMVSALSGPASSNYRTWALNLRKGALTEYDNFEFNSFATFNGYVIAAGSSGIVTLGTQDLDNATVITARVRSGKDSFGSSVHKRVPRAYIGHVADGDLHFRMITNEGGTRTYLLGWNHATGLQQRRVPIGKGPKSRYWTWEVENILGADFDIDNIMLYPTKLRRRVQ